MNQMIVATNSCKVTENSTQVFDEMREFRSNTRRHKAFVQQRMKQLEMEFKYLELLSEEEKEYLYNEREQVR